jgi:hypothetical protein
MGSADAAFGLSVVAIVISLSAAAYAYFQVQEIVRFRNPKFVVREATFAAKRSGRYLDLGPGTIRMDVRGAHRPTTLTEWHFAVDPEHRISVVGTSQLNIQIPEEVWSPLSVTIDNAMGLPHEKDPATLDCELYLRNPLDVHTVEFSLTREDSGKVYSFVAFGDLVKAAKRTYRRKRRVRNLLRAVPILRRFVS